MGETDFMVRIRGLRKAYDEIIAVDDVSFDIRRGEIFGLLGPNGAGKTTTISILSGILAPTGGEIELSGQPYRPTPAMRRLLGVVPQELAIYPKLTGAENLAFFGELYGLSGGALRERVQSMLDLVGLSDRAASRAETYSGGMKRRLNLAAGLMHSPSLLLLDEPTVGVDPQSRNHIFEGVRALNRQGLTVIYTSHYMEEVQALCDRVGIMDRGKLIACDTVPALIAGQGAGIIELGLGIALADAELLSRLTHVELVEGATALSYSDASVENGSEAHTTVHVRSAHPERALAGLVSALNELNVPLLALNIKKPSLEDVFLAKTGKSLRD
jgi:ABC-2 type transport system ATP-binding protein